MPRILLVEDNEMNRDMLSRRLKKRGYEVEIAIDGQEGVDMARSSPPDLILMDMSLPVKDGWTATSELKADPEMRAVPIVALTAHAMAGDRDKALEAGCDAYETKPIELPRLLETIQKLLGQES
ncbi:MAG: response regulator [Myxococcota bacterium]|nr:response regulator [Myxococcota bacterium]